MQLNSSRTITAFKRTVWSYYKKHKRPMPWRDNTSPYYVAVSEIMLQQTQVSRVMQKFSTFIAAFPDWQSLARAETKEVLREWSGLGYNRRALFLKRIAEHITHQGTVRGVLPKTVEQLQELPGIGPNTAGSILAFAYNMPHAFIETNIRSVYIHFFFPTGSTCKSIHDRDILPLVERTLDHAKPREWYYALMDYGSYLKKQVVNPSRKSAHHITQKPFKGSNRELRADILRTIMKQSITKNNIVKAYSSHTSDRILKNIEALEKEGFIHKKGAKYLV